MTADQEALDVAMVIAGVAAEHQPSGITRRECFAHGDYGVPWMCDTARVAMALAAVMDLCDDGEDEARARGLASPLVRTDQLRSLIAGAINFTPPEQ